MVYIDREELYDYDPDDYNTDARAVWNAFILKKFNNYFPEYIAAVEKAVKEDVSEVEFLQQPLMELRGALVLSEELVKMADAINNVFAKVSDQCLTTSR